MKNTVQLIKLLLIPLVILSATRAIFFLWNYNHYDGISALPFIYGVSFDISTVCMFFSPFIFFYFLVNKFKQLKTIEHLLFITGIITITLLNLIDTAFIQFSQKRSGQELLALVSSGEEFFNLLPSYLMDFWLLVIIFTLICWGANKMYKKLRIKQEFKLVHIFHFVLIVGLVILGIRGKIGGFSSRPLDTIDASKYVAVKFVPVVLNTPFSIVKSFEKKQLQPVNYFSQEELNKLYNPIHEYTKQETNKTNIVILILESFSAAYMGTYNSSKGYTPFLDSLIKEGLFYPNCFANGTHSAEAVPSIFASVPALIDEGLIFSEYVNTKTNSIPEHLNKKGYYSAFFHGANNGSMHFDSYTKAIGFDNYYGRNEYNNNDHFDGKWGIFDHYFYEYAIKKTTQFKTPFLSTIFSLSSHHPYNIPEQFKDNFKGGDMDIHKSIEYADWSLSHFFELAQKQPWYNNTLFIVTADHTSYTRETRYKHLPNNYKIPLLLFHPNNKEFQQKIDSSITMHVDIFPSIVEYTGGNDTIVSFGNSIFRKLKDNHFFALNNNVYQYYQNDILLQFDGNKTIGLYNIKTDPYHKNNLISELDYDINELKIKAIIQQFNNRLIKNQLSAE